jgi:hypothetical protein
VAIYSEYVLTDRTTADARGLFINDSQVGWQASVGAPQSEFIVEDNVNAGTYWKIFIDDGQIGFESTATVQDDEVILQDQSTAEYWRFEVRDGQLFMENNGVVVAVGSGVIFKRRRR